MCPCHAAALISRATCTKIPDYCEEFLKKISAFIKNSPKRTAVYDKFCNCFQETNHKIAKLSNTRWLSHHTCVERVLESWNTIKHFLTDMILNEK